MSELKYQYAWNETRTFLIHINEAKSGGIYYCVNSQCNEQMIVKDGGCRRKHFSHKNEGVKCSYDNYLHTLAEVKFIEWFKTGRIQYRIKQEIVCDNYHNCTWLEEGEELHEECKCLEYAAPICLNDVYNKIEKERKDYNYRWDLFLSNTERISTPLAIEILVTHLCEDSKISFSLPIIEIKIESEEQLDKLISSGVICENEYNTFHNFERRSVYGTTEGIELNKVFLDNKFELIPIREIVNCRNYTEGQPNSLLELTLDCSLEWYDWVKLIDVLAMKYIPGHKYKEYCLHYVYSDIIRDRICLLKRGRCSLMSNIDCDKFIANQQTVDDCFSFLEKNQYHEIWIRYPK